MLRRYIFTSESVTEGHPEKICDQVSDSILDEFLASDSDSRVAVESLTSTGIVFVAGEVTSRRRVDIQKVVRAVIREIGYDRPEYGFDSESCSVLESIHEQSPDISLGVTPSLNREQGAGDRRPRAVRRHPDQRTDHLGREPETRRVDLDHPEAPVRPERDVDDVREPRPERLRPRGADPPDRRAADREREARELADVERPVRPLRDRGRDGVHREAREREVDRRGREGRDGRDLPRRGHIE